MSDNQVFNIYHVTEYKDKKTGEIKEFKRDVGTGFSHKKGGGFNLDLSVYGLKLKMWPRTSKDEQRPEADTSSDDE